MEMRIRTSIDWKMLLITAIGMLLIVQALRGGVSTPLMNHSYRTLHHGNLEYNDNLVLGNPMIWHTPLDLLSGLFNSPGVLLIMSVLSSLACAGLFYLLLKEFEVEERYNAALLWIVSPVMLHMAYVADGMGLAIAAQLLGVYSILKNTRGWSIIALGALLVSSYHGYWHGVIALAMLLILGYHKPELRANLIGIGFGLLIFGIIIQFERFIAMWPLQQYDLRYYGSWISDLGGFGGIGVFTLFLGMFDMIRKHKIWILPTGLIILMSYLDRSVLPYALCILAWTGGDAIGGLQKRKWATKDLQWITIILILCGVLFSPMSYAKQLQGVMPDENLKLALDQIEGDAIVFTSPQLDSFVQERGHMIILPETYASEGALDRLNSSMEIFHTYDLQLVIEKFEDWGVTHVLVTPEMTSGQIWEEKDQGLHYLLQDSRFRNIYREEGYGLWEVRI